MSISSLALNFAVLLAVVVSAHAEAGPAPAVEQAASPYQSRLFSTPSTKVLEGRLVGAADTRALVWEREGEGLVLLASLKASGDAKYVWKLTWRPVGLPSQTMTAEIRLASLEHLYAMVLRHDAGQRFDFVIDGAKRVASRAQGSAVLQLIASLRECAARDAQGLGGHSIARWSYPKLTAMPFTGPERKLVVARVQDAMNRPIRDAHVSFARGEHFNCNTQTDALGIARCTLTDPHGHEVEPAVDRSPTFVRFAGLVTDGYVVPPALLVGR